MPFFFFLRGWVKTFGSGLAVSVRKLHCLAKRPNHVRVPVRPPPAEVMFASLPIHRKVENSVYTMKAVLESRADKPSQNKREDRPSKVCFADYFLLSMVNLPACMYYAWLLNPTNIQSRRTATAVNSAPEKVRKHTSNFFLERVRVQLFRSADWRRFTQLRSPRMLFRSSIRHLKLRHKYNTFGRVFFYILSRDQVLLNNLFSFSPFPFFSSFLFATKSATGWLSAV